MTVATGLSVYKVDAQLVQIVDAALADVTLRSGKHLLCRPGCSQCCIGAFAINTLDADRLRRGYEDLRRQDPARFSRVRLRVADSVALTAAEFPGDPATGELDGSPEGTARFEAFANEEMCPVLDPESHTCDLYRHRPMTCRVFGPPVRAAVVETTAEQETVESGLGVCELCFTGASPAEIASCELVADPLGLEDSLLRKLEAEGVKPVCTTVAYALSTWNEDGK